MEQENKRTVFNTMKLILTQRKGQMVLFAFIVATGNIVSTTKSYFAGKLSTDSFYTHLEIWFAALMAVIGLYIGSQAYEDGQEKSGPKTQMALGDHAKAVSVKTLEQETDKISEK